MWIATYQLPYPDIRILFTFLSCSWSINYSLIKKKKSNGFIQVTKVSIFISQQHVKHSIFTGEYSQNMLFLQTLKFTLCLVFSYWFLLIKRELVTPATPYAPLQPCLSSPSASSHSQFCIYMLPASVPGTGTSSSWTVGPVKSLLK